MTEGIFRKAGKINILELDGTYRQMGRQYGGLLKAQLGEFYDIVISKYLIKEERMSYVKLLVLARILFYRYPAKFKEMFKGMSEASGISLNKLIMLDQLNVFEMFRHQKIGHCSNISAWADHSEGGVLVFGRNFDQPEYFKKFSDFITVVVFSPDDGIPFANVGYAGQIGINTAMNKKGIILANNEAPVLKGDAIHFNVLNILVAEFEFMTKSNSLDELDGFIKNVRTNCPIIISTADARAAHTYELISSDKKRMSGNGSGLVVATNHFTDPSWERMAIPPGEYGMTGTRLNNLTSLAEIHKGRFNARKMQELLDITVDDGGATHKDDTIFQMVALPEEMKFYIKIPGLQDWTQIDLKAPFDRCDQKDR